MNPQPSLSLPKTGMAATGSIEMTFDKEFTRFRCVDKKYE